jgi:hypothetical protein
MEDIEEWEDIPACDKATAEPNDAVPFEKAVRQTKGAAHPTRCSRGFRSHGRGTARTIPTGLGLQETPQSQLDAGK